MAKFEVIMPKLGESIIEATITRWIKQPGEMIEEDDPIVEIATDKVDSEIPSPVEGKLIEVKYKEGDVVEVGKIIAVIDTEPGSDDSKSSVTVDEKKETTTVSDKAEITKIDDKNKTQEPTIEKKLTEEDAEAEDSDRFYSPLVKNIAKAEGISVKELEQVKGSGKEGRVTKNDLLSYLEERKSQPAKKADTSVPKEVEANKEAIKETVKPAIPSTAKPTPQVTAHQGDEIVEMDRMRKLIADHMVMSKQVSPHVTSFIEVDVTNMVKWREKVKDEFLKREKEKITFTPIFVEAATQAIKELPGVNASVDGYNIILRKNINIGIAAALPSGNLIVPVIKNADQKSLLGLAKEVNNLADKARKNKLDPDDIQGGTFTITNLGTFGSITGSPIINQPQVAILGLGVIKKKPVVLETPDGDVIAIRHMVILSLAYDHRVVDGALGGMFLQKMQQILERFDINRTI
ncbi:MAG: dihydrolipoamide acetyltransferase family protein [Omnitrophica WOR_2 bacterium]|jgi:2-oxoglutarate dehydrogenase E2 component (dihydrolipoamide succinyltransferase)